MRSHPSSRRPRRSLTLGAAGLAVFAATFSLVPGAVPAGSPSSTGANAVLAGVSRASATDPDLGSPSETTSPPPARPPADGDAAHDPLAQFRRQQPTWAPCSFNGALECATVMAPMDYRHPEAERITLAVSRRRAADPARRRGVLLLNPGGPGGSGLQMPKLLLDQPTAQVYDLVGFDPRGVGRSTALACEQTPMLYKPESRPTDDVFPWWVASARESEEACARAGGALRPHVNTPNTARDMDLIRSVLGEEKINYVGYSYGTYLGAVYGSLFPERLDRSVLDSSVHPDWIWREQFKRQGTAYRDNVDLWAEWAAKRNATLGLGDSRDAVLGTVEQLARKLSGQPVAGYDRSSLDGAVGVGARYRPLWADLAKVVRSLRDGNSLAATQDAVRAGQLMTDVALAELRAGVFDTVTCEADWPQDTAAYLEDMRVFRERYPYGYGVMRAVPWPCTFRSFAPPERPVPLRRAGYPVGLVVQAAGDTQTQYAGGPAMAARLAHHLITVSDEGEHGMYGFGNACVDQQVNAYLVDGMLPPTRSECPGRARPEVPEDPPQGGQPPKPATELTPEGSIEESVRNYLDAGRIVERAF
ncbi:alpha/beta fold hydrolase [Streptoalloteichus hindustanus]|uniref:TAP-like protein n=1 Tax=Streptoalloteichus hindustanus TaxID=2017 RepID=A0A1M5BFA9_STRHI|nr:alpha/beta fold hydrolase [Streptoalloteichus hindustanus]SHF40852.1 TAP-like protein [Streptoalloteichus hindustanus]